MYVFKSQLIVHTIDRIKRKSPMGKTLHYLFDPLCGWCYGATPVASGLLQVPGVRLDLLPTGLFSNEGARPMD